jgi:hypothetical protein
MSDQAVVTSVHNNNDEGTTRIDLRWDGKHEIADFSLEKLGKVLNCESETEDSGWVLVEYPGNAKPGDAVSES